MRITRQSILTGKIHSFEMDVTEQEWERFCNGEFAQRVWPHFSAEKREFLMNGTTPDEASRILGEPMPSDVPNERGEWGGKIHNILYLYTIYDHPSDFPDAYVVRRWKTTANGSCEPEKEPFLIDKDLQKIIPKLEAMGLIFLPPKPWDDPIIFGSYV